MWNVEPKIACCQAESSAAGDRKDGRTKHICPKKEGNGAGKFGKERKCYVFLIFLLTGKGTYDILFTERRRSFFYAKKTESSNGGGSLENKDYLSLYRVQTKKLQHNQRQESDA